MSKNIGLIDVDNTRFPNLALMKLSAMHKQDGDTVSWYDPFENYDIVYKSKVFTFTPDYRYPITNADQIIKGGSGYDLTTVLPERAEYITPDYSIYPYVPKNTAYGYLTRGCVNNCSWCIVPKKEGAIRPYMDIDDVAAGRKNVVLMDNNILAAGDYGISQLVKIIEKGYRVDFNQAMDARLVTPEIADLLVQVKWISHIRFGCDTDSQIEDCERTINMLNERGYKKLYVLYTMIHGKPMDNYRRISYWRGKYQNKVSVTAQPYVEYSGKNKIPKWQKDLARWANRRWFYHASDFMDFYIRNGVTGKMVLETADQPDR